MKRKILSLILVFAMTVSLLTVGTGAVEPASGGSESTEKQVNLVLVDGQSNAYGGAGTMTGADGANGTVDIPNKDTAFLWESGTLVDISERYNDYTETASVGFHPALAKALYEKTQIPSVIIHLGHSGQSISKWSDPTTGYTKQAVEAVKACRAYLTQNGYTIVNSGYIWMQGESDACPTPPAGNCTYTTLGEYYNAYTTIHNAYIKALGNGAVGGIITVQTRRQLDGGVANASEYCGVRAAQQALANQLPNLIIASDITDGWRSSTDKSYFASAGGNIHYSQAGYNKIGADAGKNLAAAWKGANAPTGFELIGFDGSTEYSEDGTIDVKDNLIYIGSDNAREKGAAQLVVKTLPVSADCAGVTMTLTDGAGAVSDAITDNGYIADASKISKGMKLTVTMGETSKTYNLTNTATTEEPNESDEPDYYWDFTDSTKVSGKTLADRDGKNKLTYQGSNDISITTDGMDNSANGRSYFLMEKPVKLKSNEPWTIEWQGSMSAASTPVANTNGGESNQTNEYIYVSYEDKEGSKYNTLWFRNEGNQSVASLAGYDDVVKSNTNTKWYAIHDGKGTLTLACTGGDGTVYQKSVTENKITQDYTYDTVLGYYLKTDTRYNYYGTIKNLAIYHHAYELAAEKTQVTGTQNVLIAAPVTGNAPQTEVSGSGYTGTVSWSPAVENTFAPNTTYTAHVTLTAGNGYAFADPVNVNVNDGTVKDISVAADGLTLTFDAEFPATQSDAAASSTDDFYWTFTNNTTQSVTGNGWTENALTETTTGSGGAARTYYKMSSAVSLPKNGAWTIEWKGTSPNSCVVLANNNDARDVNGKGAEYIYVANNSGSEDSTELFFVKSGGASGSNIRLSNIPDAVKNNSDATWYIIHDGNGNLTLAVYGNGQLVKTTLSNVIDQDYSYNAIKGYYSTGMPIGYNGNLDYMKIYHEAAELPVAKMNDDFYWTFTNNTAQSVTEDGWTENALTATTIGSGGAARTYYKMSSAVSLPKNGAWTIEWKGTSPNSCVVLANNNDARDVNGKGAEYIYVANNSGSEDSTELFFVKSGGASGSNIRLSNIPDAVKNNSDATWYIIHDGNGNLTLAVYGNGQLVKTTLSNVIDRDYSYNAIKGYYITGTPIGYNGNLDYMKIYHEAAELPVAKMNNEVYTSLADAVAAAPTETYPNTPTTAATITLLTDVESGFDIGVESHNISNFKTQNIEIDLNSHTLKLGHPPVGSSAILKTNGLRVLAFSKLTIRNGNLIASDGNVLIAIANYGTLLMDGVNMSVGEQVLYTINNRGDLTLQGATKVPDGKVVAITNEPYDYPDTQNINAKLNVASETVEVGNVQIELGDVKQSQTNAINSGVPEINISAGSFGKIYDDGKTAKTPIGNITGGTFSEIVPENLCGSGYISVAKTGEDGKFTVKQGEYIVEMTVNGKTTKYESINDAVANAPVDSYANGKQGQKAAKASIKLLKDTTGGFDVGVETGSLATWKIQNIEIDLNGKTLTLGQPLVGSTGTKTNGIRVLAYSELTIRNGKIKNGDARNTALRGLQNYGVAVIEDVEFADMSRAYDTIGNFGSLELKGHTIVPNGRNSAILNDSYLYSDDSQVPYKLVIKDANVSVGKITLDLSKHTHGQTGTINAANPELTITTGNMESISASGSDKTLVGGVTGGSFDNTVPENLCGAGYIPVTKKDENGKYTVTIPHTITFDANGGVVTSTTANTNGAGTLSELPTPVRDGYRFNGWFTAASGGTMITTSTVFGANTTVYAQWTYVSNPSSGGSYSDTSYDVAIDKTEHGTVTVSPKSASKGDRVTVTVKPDNGYVLDDLTVTDKNGNELKLTDKGNGKYTFTMPSGRVEVKASFAKEVETSPFADVAIDDYYYEAVKWAVKNGITTGVGNDLFAPGQPCTRAQIVTFLWRAAGSPEPKGAASGMTDVVSGSYYEKAVAWAIENGVTTGTTATTFSPDATCTRAQAVTFLARALNAKAASAAEFSDVPTDSYFADAVAWAAANGVTEGIGGGLFGSDNDCTRGQIVTFLYRAYNK